jgi:hypothetical protein
MKGYPSWYSRDRYVSLAWLKHEGKHNCYFCYDNGVHVDIDKVRTEARLGIPLDGYYRRERESDEPTLYRKCPRCGALPRYISVIEMTPDDIKTWLKNWDG